MGGFLVTHLNFKWDQVHEIAEQLEHIKSSELINRLDDFLGNPTIDPHGDPIPMKTVNSSWPFEIIIRNDFSRTWNHHRCEKREFFLLASRQIKIHLGLHIEVIEVNDFDQYE